MASGVIVQEDREQHDQPAPAFGLPEAEAIVRALAPALHDHGRWIRHIHATLIARSAPAPEDLAAQGDAASLLGRWLGEDNAHFLSRLPECDAAREQHRRAHALARALCQAVADSRPISRGEYHAFAEAVAELDRNMEALVNELWNLLRHTDPLTGIATRFALLPRLREEQSRLRRTGAASSVCMMDLDYFKQINDRYGHAAGDRVLEAVSAFVARHVRRHDQVCRYGGEEFVLLLPDTEPASALPMIDRLRRGLAEHPIELPGGERVCISGSFGLAPLSPEQPVEDSIRRADTAMYAAKRGGRNRVCVWREGDDEPMPA
jgi:diguanylate cyclase (GGDEF)-like protein